MFITTLNRNRNNTLNDLFNEWDNIFSNNNSHYSSDYKTSSAYGTDIVRTPSITVASIPSLSKLSLIVKM